MYQTLVDTEVNPNKEIEENAHVTVFADFLIKNSIEESAANAFQSHYEKLRDDFYLGRDKKIDHHDFKKLVSQTFDEFYGIHVEDKILGDLIWQYRIMVRGKTRLYDGVKETLEKLSKEYDIFLASYTQASYSLLELEELGVKEYFKGFIFSSDIGYRKASDNFYKKCIEVSGTDASNCVMIGDHPFEDMYMANKNGMKTIWIKNPASKHRADDCEVAPDGEVDIEDLYKLPEIIKSI